MKLLSNTTIIFMIFLNLLMVEKANCEVSDPNPITKVCSSCHNKPFNLKDRGVDVIIKQIKAIKSSKKQHPPSGIKELCDEDIKEIAEFFNNL